MKALEKERYVESVGRRKTAVARVRIFPTKKSGLISINGRTLISYFPSKVLQDKVMEPLKLVKADDPEVSVKVSGGGSLGQAEAIRHGIGKVLLKINPEDRKRLKKAGYLKRDPRMKERKKPGLKKARRAPQWAKR